MIEYIDIDVRINYNIYILHVLLEKRDYLFIIGMLTKAKKKGYQNKGV